MSTCELDRFVIQTTYIKVVKSCFAPFVDSCSIAGIQSGTSARERIEDLFSWTVPGQLRRERLADPQPYVENGQTWTTWTYKRTDERSLKSPQRVSRLLTIPALFLDRKPVTVNATPDTKLHPDSRTHVSDLLSSSSSSSSSSSPLPILPPQRRQFSIYRSIVYQEKMRDKRSERCRNGLGNVSSKRQVISCVHALYDVVHRLSTPNA